jgi:glutamate transport system substrate-binding protein
MVTFSLCRRRIAAVVACSVLLVGCSASGNGDDDVYVVSDPAFAAGTTMAKLYQAGKVRIGVRFDQPGIGYQDDDSDAPTGFDIEIAKIIAGQLGLGPDKIDWVETEAQNRGTLLQRGEVDLVVAAYTITPERQKAVGLAGPYYVTGQQLMVRRGDKSISGPRDVKGRKVCSATGSTPLRTIRDQYHAAAVSRPFYQECVKLLTSGSVDAVTTDGAILLGYVAQRPKQLKVVGKPFTRESYGVGYRKNDTAMCRCIDRALQSAYYQGTWDSALYRTLWRTTRSLPDPPLTTPCP